MCLQTVRDSTLSRGPFESSSPPPPHPFKRLLIPNYNQIPFYLCLTLCTEESGDVSFNLEEFFKCFPETFYRKKVSNFSEASIEIEHVLNLPSQLLINSLAFTRLIEETLLSAVPETVIPATADLIKPHFLICIDDIDTVVDYYSFPHFDSLVKHCVGKKTLGWCHLAVGPLSLSCSGWPG